MPLKPCLLSCFLITAMVTHALAGPPATTTSPARNPKVEAETRAAQMEQELKQREARKDLTPEQIRDIALTRSFIGIGLALAKDDAKEAAKYFFVEGDPQSDYAQGRQKRLIAARNLAIAADREIASGAASLLYECNLVTLADDMYALAMCEWKYEDDRAVGKPRGSSERMWIPDLRKTDNIWKIDITPELAGRDPKLEAARAQSEAEKLTQITAQIKAAKLTTLDQVRSAMRTAQIRGNPVPPAEKSN